MSQNNVLPLVSVVVITYNSSQYVLETLESIKNQSYHQIELIISDDASNDLTVNICSKWLKANAQRFVRAELITSESNTGIASNCNRGLIVTSGEWVKIIAGDDLLALKAIEKYILYADENNENVKVICGLVVDFEDTFSINRLNGVIWDLKFFSLAMTAAKQFKRLIIANRIPAAGVIIRRSLLLDECGGFDERFPMLEDYPLWIKLTQMGVQIFGMREIVAFYRIHSASIYGSDLRGSAKLINSNFRLHRRYEKEFLIPRLPLIGKISKAYEFMLAWLIYKLGNNSNNRFLKLLVILKEKFNPLIIFHLFKV